MAEEKFTPKKKTYVEDIERTLYDIKDADHSVYKTQSGLTEEIIRDISKRKHDPQWMLDFRLKSLEVYNSLALPTWGPDISELNMDDIVTYVQPDAKMTGNWQEVPTDIKNTFDRLGIPEAEQKQSLAGVGAQYDSEVVYHSIQEDLVKQGVIYTDMETAIREHEDVVKEYFMTLVPPKDHKFAALHGAVWSGGSFVYVPEGVAKFHNEDNSCLIITHNTRILEKLKVDKVHVLINGEIVEEGGPELIDDINRRGFTHILDAQAEK